MRPHTSPSSRTRAASSRSPANAKGGSARGTRSRKAAVPRAHHLQATVLGIHATHSFDGLAYIRGEDDENPDDDPDAQLARDRREEDREVRREWVLLLEPTAGAPAQRRLFVAFRSGTLAYYREEGDGRLTQEGEAPLGAVRVQAESGPKEADPRVLRMEVQSGAAAPRALVVQAYSVESAGAWRRVLALFVAPPLQTEQLPEGARGAAPHAGDAASSEEHGEGGGQAGPMTQELLLPRRQAGELRRGWFLVRQRGRALLAAASRWERRLLIASADGTLAHFLEAPRGGLVQAGAPLDLGTLELHPAYSAADEQASCRPQHARYPGGEPAHHVAFSAAVAGGGSRRRVEMVLHCSSRVTLGGLDAARICESWRLLLTREQLRLRSERTFGTAAPIASLHSERFSGDELLRLTLSEARNLIHGSPSAEALTPRGSPLKFAASPSLRQGPELQSFLLSVDKGDAQAGRRHGGEGSVRAIANGVSAVGRVSAPGTPPSPARRETQLEQVYTEEASPILADLTRTSRSAPPSPAPILHPAPALLSAKSPARRLQF
mmetsp:Transcript_7358/g.27050  ORF Transcript_7358/g.27050 Transcript_7358/m.27050 type:complete len:551 (-) Transcript_7358:187-1839(-)